MSVNLSLQDARTAHLEGIDRLLAGWVVRADGSVDKENFDFLHGLVEESIRSTESRERFFVAVDSQKTVIAIVGCTAELFPVLKPYTQSNNPIQLSVLMVDKELSGQGIGTKTLSKFEKWAKESGYQEIVLTSSERWKDSWDFYTTAGYEDCGEMENTQNFHTRIFRRALG